MDSETVCIGTDRFVSQINCFNPFCAGNKWYTYANRLDPGQPPSNSAAGLRSNLFATQTINAQQRTSWFSKFWIVDDTSISIRLPSIPRVTNAMGIPTWLMSSIEVMSVSLLLFRNDKNWYFALIKSAFTGLQHKYNTYTAKDPLKSYHL